MTKKFIDPKQKFLGFLFLLVLSLAGYRVSEAEKLPSPDHYCLPEEEENWAEIENEVFPEEEYCLLLPEEMIICPFCGAPVEFCPEGTEEEPIFPEDWPEAYPFWEDDICPGCFNEVEMETSEDEEEIIEGEPSTQRKS
jgi:hypothetical protein